MPVRRPTTSRQSAQGQRRTASSKAPARKAAAPAAPAARQRDVTEYANKPATAYHKAFAKWIVEEVGYDPNTASSLRAAFLRGVSIATAARPAFQQSDFVEEWREKTGESKRGPKPQEEKAVPARRGRKPAAQPEPEEDDDFEDEIDDEEDELDDDFDDDDASDDDDDFDDDDESEDDDDEEDEEPAPAPKARTRTTAAAGKAHAARRGPAKAAPAKKASAPRGKASSGSARTTKPAADDDDFVF